LTTLATAAVTAAVLIAAFVLAGGADNGGAAAAPEKLPPLAPPPAGTKDVGPEGVAMPSAKPLGRASSAARGASRGGIPCGAAEQLSYHVHAHLTIFVDGRPRAIPLGVGIGPPLRVTNSGRGPFASGGTCFSFLHTHAADGIIHIESPIVRTYTLGDFFDIWHEPLSAEQLGPARGKVTAFFDGRRYLGSPRGIPLLAHAQIQLDAGRPLVAPETIDFPAGL
jgi:hypothetical protein